MEPEERRGPNRAIHRTVCECVRHACLSGDSRGASRSRASGAENRTRRECGPRSRSQEYSDIRESGQRLAGSLDRPRADLRRTVYGTDAHGEGVPESIGVEAIEGEAQAYEGELNVKPSPGLQG